MTKTVENNVSAISRENIALTMAAAVAGNLTLTQDTEEVLSSAVVLKRAPLWILADLKAAGVDVAAYPHPDSKAGNNPAKFEGFRKDPKTGEKKAYTVDWYNVYCSGLPTGKRIAAALAAISEEEKVSKSVATSEEKKSLNQQMNNLRNLYRRAIKLEYQFNAVNSLPHVAVAYRMTKGEDGADVLKSTPYPINLYNPKDPTDFNILSIGSFLGLNVAAAQSNGGTKEALLATAGKGTTEDEEAETPAIDSVETFEDYAAEMEASFENDRMVGEIYSRLNGKDSDDFLLTMFSLARHFELVCNKPALQARFKAINEAKLSAKSAKAS